MSKIRTNEIGSLDGVYNATVEDLSTINQRTLYVNSVAELEALSLDVGVNVYLTQDGRAGEFVVKAGTPPSDPQKGIYVVLANGNYAERIYTPGAVNASWFGDDGAAVVAASSFSEHVKIEQAFSFGSSVTLSSFYYFSGSGQFIPEAGVILTLNGAVSAPQTYIFDVTNGDIQGNFRCDGEVLYPEWFGAGVVAQDDVPINYAINLIQTYRRGGTLQLGSTVYDCHAPVVCSVDGPITIKGTGTKETTKVKASVLDFSNASETARGVVVEGAAAVAGVNLESFMVQKDTLVTVSGSIAVHFKGACNCSIYDVHCNNFDIGLVLDETASIRTSRCSFKDFFVWNTRTGGFELKGCFDNSFVSCFALGSAGGEWNIHFTEGSSGTNPNATHFTDCMFIDTGNPTRCLLAETGFWNTFTGCVFEQAGTEAIRFQYTGQAPTSIISAVFTNCWTDAVPSIAAIIVGANVIFDSCRLQTTGAQAVKVDSSLAGRSRGASKFINNTIVAEGTGGTYVVQIFKQTGTIVSNNIIEGPGDAGGLLLSGGTISPDYSVVTGNAFYRCTATPVIDSSTGSVVANNTAEI